MNSDWGRINRIFYGRDTEISSERALISDLRALVRLSRDIPSVKIKSIYFILHSKIFEFLNKSFPKNS
jgi:hypothetical protein